MPTTSPIVLAKRLSPRSVAVACQPTMNPVKRPQMGRRSGK